MTADRFAGRTVLVTGAQGFVGSWLAERLLDSGARVAALRRDVEPESRFYTSKPTSGAPTCCSKRAAPWVYAHTYELPVSVRASRTCTGAVTYLAVAASLERPELRGREWNAGRGAPLSVRELVDRLVAVSGRDLEPDVQGDGTPHGEIDRQYLDSTAIREELGWQPSRELDEGLAAAWEWYERRLS